MLTSDYQKLFAGLENILKEMDFEAARKNILDNAFKKIFAEQSASNLKWKRSGEKLDVFVTEISLKNLNNEDVKAQVFLKGAGNRSAYSGGLFSVYLTIGNEKDSPCRNSADPRVRDMYEQITGEKI